MCFLSERLGFFVKVEVGYEIFLVFIFKKEIVLFGWFYLYVCCFLIFDFNVYFIE